MRHSIKKVRELRNKAARRQGQRCYYCDRHMSNVAQMRCTAEHLVPRSERGPNSASNIVAACLFCNAMRHRGYASLPPEHYREAVRAFISHGLWHEHHHAWHSLA